ncbi:acyl-CoA carboxylase subunit beta [Micromonospora sp. NPDC049081]|uniref:acyl-CoA carboxylase subunit beta n=1 Tax=Micromonospora sp. NPDC049081 TaxID=3155150 RepID=UPI0033CA7D1D
MTADEVRTRIAELDSRLADTRDGGSPRAVARQREAGKLTVRERISLLFDPGSFAEIDALVRSRPDPDSTRARPYGDGMIIGHGLIEGRPAFTYAHDFTVQGGSMGEASGGKVLKAMDLALQTGCPIIGLNDSGGARIQEGVAAVGFYAELVRRNVAASGIVPQLSLILGPCAGGAAYSPAITDFVIMAERTAHMFVTGPDAVRAALGEDTDMDTLGSGRVNATISGNAHHLAADEADAIAFARRLLSYLPSNHTEPPPAGPAYDTSADVPALAELIPGSSRKPLNVAAVIENLVDPGSFLEIQPRYARNMLCGLARIGGLSIGIVANQPTHKAGVIDGRAAEKAARFIRCCDAFNVPIVTLVDVPGFMPGTTEEHAGMIRRGAKLAYAFAEATVPRITLVLRKAYGGGYGVMGSKHLGADMNFAWPTAEIAVMGAHAAVDILHRAELATATEPEQARAKLMEDYQAKYGSPYLAAERGFIDAVIPPAESRRQIAAALRLLSRRPLAERTTKHGNIPL